MILLNDQGWLLTCNHVAGILGAKTQIASRYDAFRLELAQAGNVSRDRRHRIARKHGLAPDELAEVDFQFLTGQSGTINFTTFPHPDLDLCLIKLDPAPVYSAMSYPTFARDTSTLAQGRSLCRIGYPFPEFSNFGYDKLADKIEFNSSGNQNYPLFPMDGIVTRFLHIGPHTNAGIELSTPSLKGQSGGPLFDADGRVWGMTFGTEHLDLDFDVKKEVWRGHKRTKVASHSFLHVGYCIHVDVIKNWMRANGVSFQEG